MELNGYRLLLPEGTLDYFDLVDVKESVNDVVFYLEEKNMVPEKLSLIHIYMCIRDSYHALLMSFFSVIDVKCLLLKGNIKQELGSPTIQK